MSPSIGVGRHHCTELAEWHAAGEVPIHPGRTTIPEVLVTTDYRSVLSEVVSTRFGVSIGSVFPQFQPDVLGLMRTT